MVDIAKNSKSIFDCGSAVDCMSNMDNLKYLRDHDTKVRHFEKRMDDDGNIHEAYDYYPIRELLKKD